MCIDNLLMYYSILKGQRTPLHMAAIMGCTDNVAHLVNSGANIYKKDDVS